MCEWRGSISFRREKPPNGYHFLPSFKYAFLLRYATRWFDSGGDIRYRYGTRISFGPGTHWAHLTPLVPGFIWSEIPLVLGQPRPTWLLWSQKSFGPGSYWSYLTPLVLFHHLVHYFPLVPTLLLSELHLVQIFVWSRSSFGPRTPLVFWLIWYFDSFGPNGSKDQRKRSQKLLVHVFIHIFVK